MPMALQTLPPLLMFPTETAPPLAEAVATPPLPAEAVSMNWADARDTPARPTTVPIAAALKRLFMAPLLPLATARSSPEALVPPVVSRTGSDSQPAYKPRYTRGDALSIPEGGFRSCRRCGYRTKTARRQEGKTASQSRSRGVEESRRRRRDGKMSRLAACRLLL